MKNLLLIFLLCYSFGNLQAQSEKEKTEATVKKNTIEGHIYFLADDLLKGRETGSPENKIAASYLANTFRSYGIKPNPKTGDYYQEVPLVKTTPPNFSLSISGVSQANTVVISAAKIDYNKEAIYLGYGLEEDYKGKNVEGKLIIITAGKEGSTDARSAFGLRDQKMELAKKAGALGIIEFLDAPARMWGYIEGSFNGEKLDLAKDDTTQSDFAYLWVQDENGMQSKDLESNQLIKVNLISGEKKSQEVLSQNVVGIIEGTDPKLKNEYIIYSAHYDHIGIGQPDKDGDSIYNGARDNAIGVTTVLSMAENIAKYPTKRSALFILFTGEEKGLLGSSYYVEHPILPLNQMVYCFNSDGGGYNDKTLATIIGLDRTTAGQHIKDATNTYGLKAIGDPVPEEGLFDRSDNVLFAAKGIPAPTFSPGFTGFTGDVDKYYHQAADEADSLDYEYLQTFFRSYVLAGRLIADDAVTPFWVAGDKYEPAGKALYSKE